METLVKISILESEIAEKAYELEQLKHAYLKGLGWKIEQISGQDFIETYMYTKGEHVTLSDDHAIEIEEGGE